MNLEIIKKDAELLLDITEKYSELSKKKALRIQKKKIKNYMNSLIMNIERNINENVERSNKNIPKSS